MEVLFYSSVSSIFRSKRYDNYIILGKAHPLPPASGGNLIFVFLEAAHDAHSSLILEMYHLHSGLKEQGHAQFYRLTQALKERNTSAKGAALCLDTQNTSSEGAQYILEGCSPSKIIFK